MAMTGGETGLHEFFEQLKLNPDLVNSRALRKTRVNTFSQFFHLLFENLGKTKQRNMNTWLTAISDGFRINMVRKLI